jgi:WD40 repeat protein
LTIRAAAAALAVAVVSWAVVSASAPTFWTVGTQADFLRGDVENLSIDSDGRMLLGPAATVVAETAAPFLWTLHVGSDGTVWTGSGNEGKLLRIGKDGQVTTFFDAGELEVHAVAPAPNGGLYVGTSPDGRIYHVAADGTAKTLFDPDDKYIWSLATDRAGNLYAATGDKGIIYKITPDGKGAPFYRTNTTNVVTLTFDREGYLLAGTESPGRVYRIDPAGKAFVLLDSPYREIHALRLAADGTIYAAAVNGDGASAMTPPEPQASEAPRAPVPTVSAEITGVTPIESPVPVSTPVTTAPRTPRRTGRGAIYRIRPDNLWDLFWDSGEDFPFDLIVEPAGTLLVGTGTEGKIFRVGGDPARATLLARAGARQVTALARDASGRILGATSNPGKIFSLSPTPAERGTYQSDVRDAGTVASWGVIRWRATLNGGRIELATRSGNTATPDETWSEWSKPYTNAAGEQITSPNARYLQWRLTMIGAGGRSPVLTSVTAAYLPRNLRPVVSSITVYPPGTVFQRPFSTGDPEIAGFHDNSPDGRQPTSASDTRQAPQPTLGRRFYQKGLQTFTWKAEDGNDDRMQFDISYRREGDTTWRVLHKGTWDPIFVWDTSSVPDGTYIVKITATDAPSNAPGSALTGELESDAFDVDNTPPRIDIQPAGTGPNARARIAFTVTDEQSAIQRVEYSLDASRWRLVHPKDGIPDSRVEEFEIVLESGEINGSVIIRATDAMNNVATAVAERR